MIGAKKFNAHFGHAVPDKVGKTGVEHSTKGSGLKKDGIGAEKERGRTRASQPIGPSDVTGQRKEFT